MSEERPPNPGHADDELLRKYQNQDRDAFDRLFDRYADRVLLFCQRLTGSRSDAEDLVSETFLAAYRGKERFRGGSRMLTYLIAIAVRRYRDGRRRPRVPTVAFHEEIEDALTLPSAEGVALSAVAFREALSRLDEPLRIAFLLVAGQGLTHKEAAEIIGAPVGTVKWRVAEATRRLRASLQEDYENEPVSSPPTTTALPHVRNH